MGSDSETSQLSLNLSVLKVCKITSCVPHLCSSKNLRITYSATPELYPSSQKHRPDKQLKRLDELGGWGGERR